MLIRRAGVLASVAFWRARRGSSAQFAAQRSIEDLASVDQSVLDDDGRREYFDAAVRVGATRLAALPASAARAGRLQVRTTAGGPGETCVSLIDTSKPEGSPKPEGSREDQTLLRRCTYGTVWTVSASGDSAGTALALAVQPLPTWRELWLFRSTRNGWRIDVLPPSSDGPGDGSGMGPGIGYIEAAGWDRATHRLLVCRESRSNERLQRRFEALSLETLGAVHQASSPDLLLSFARWQDPSWSSNTVALR